MHDLTIALVLTLSSDDSSDLLESLAANAKFACMTPHSLVIRQKDEVAKSYCGVHFLMDSPKNVIEERLQLPRDL